MDVRLAANYGAVEQFENPLAASSGSQRVLPFIVVPSGRWAT